MVKTSLLRSEFDCHKVGIIGAGDVVRRFYMPTLIKRPNIIIRAICSAHGSSAMETAKKYNIPIHFTDYRELINKSDVDTIFICTPPFTHRDIVEYALSNGKNVLVEKPVCTSYEDLKYLISLAKRSTGVFYFTFNNRLRDENQWLKNKILNGNLGKIKLIDIEWLRKKPIPDNDWWHDPQLSNGGVLADLGSHMIMISLGVIARRKNFNIACINISDNRKSYMIEDLSIATIMINDYILINLKVGWGMSISENARVNINMYCENGVISNHDFEGEKSDGYGYLIDEFFHYIKSGFQPDLSILADTMKLLHSLYDSSRFHKVIAGEFDN